MSKKLLSFIGTTKYLEAFYSFGDGFKTERPCVFIQEALIEIFCKDWSQYDNLIVLATKTAKERNWLSINESDVANFEIGLKDRLTKLKKLLKSPIGIRIVEIPEGKSEDELWAIFDIINDVIDEGDEVIFDITNSFRSLPILVLIALNYVKFLKNVKISKIVYGAMEAAGTPAELSKLPVNKRVIPIFDLTPFATLFDWTVAIERFLSTGNADALSKLGTESIKPLLISTRGEIGTNLKKMIKSLEAFSKNVATCREPDLNRNIAQIVEFSEMAEDELEHLKPFKPLFTQVKNRFMDMQNKIKDSVTLGIEVSEWCLDKGLIQQGFTILRETIVNYVMEKVLQKSGDDLKKRDYRTLAEEKLNAMNKSIPNEILNLWSEIIDYRNDINHAGWRDNNYHSYKNLRMKLEEFIIRFKQFIET